MKEIRLLDTDMPQSVVCANCGRQAYFEDYDYDGTDSVTDNGIHILMYLCESDECAWWTEWEIDIEDGEVESSELYYRPNDQEGSMAWYEARGCPHFWMPDGLRVPASLPKRAQRKRIKGWTKPPNSRYCGRPSKYGNPFRIGMKLGAIQAWIVRRAGYWDKPADTAIDNVMATNLYRVWAIRQIEEGKLNLEPLRQYDFLLDWCPLDHDCHVDVIIELLERTVENV